MNKWIGLTAFFAACLALGGFVNAFCTDSDGGMNYFVQGACNSTNNSGTDYCSTGTYLVEYFCYEDLMCATDGYACGGSCVDGACVNATPTPIPSPTPTATPTPSPSPTPIPSPTAFCNDSDGGKSYYVKGTVATQNASFIDYCTSQKNLREYYCNGANPAYESYKCSKKCSAGACTGSGAALMPTAEEATDYTPFLAVAAIAIVGMAGFAWMKKRK